MIIPFAALLLLAGCGKGKDAPPPRPASLVEVERVRPATFIDRLEAIGSAVANEQVVLAAPVTERIVRLNFADGGYVRAGQVIATLAQGQETADLNAANARAREAQQQLDRVSALKARGFATGAALDTQVAARDAALASAALAKASMGDRVIVAPFSGWLSLRTISAGAIVTAGTPVATISDISRIKLDFDVPETQLAMIREGQVVEASATAYPDHRFSGTIATIDPAIDPATRAVKVRAILPNGDRLLKPGMLLTVRVRRAQREALAVPELAVVGDGEDRFVFVAREGKARRVPVKTGLRQDGRVEILSGLRAGDAVVTEGVVKLSDGAPIRLAGERKGAAPGAVTR